MPNYIFNIPVSYTPEDNESYINKTTILFKDCSGFSNPNDGCPGYTFNKCPNDDNYLQPYIIGDLIYFQIKLDSKNYPSYEWTLVNLQTSESFVPSSAVSSSQIDSERTQFITFVIDTSDVDFADITCWYLKIELGGYDNVFLTSEPFRVVQCNEVTLLITGMYDGKDCNGNFYSDQFQGGLIPGGSLFKLSFRVHGVVEPNGYSIASTFNGKKKIKSKQTERFLLRTEKLPYYVAQQIAAAINSEQLTIDGIDYIPPSKLDKSFDEGSEWIITEDLFIDCDEINFTCNN